MINWIVISLGPIENIPCSFHRMTNCRVLFVMFIHKWYINVCDLYKTFFSDMLKYWLVVLTIVKTFESFVHIVLRKFAWFVICMRLMKTCNLFRTITKCSDHCVNCFENSDLSLEKCVKSIEKNCNIPVWNRE